MRRFLALSLLLTVTIAAPGFRTARAGSRAPAHAAPDMPRPRGLRCPAGGGAVEPRLIATGDGALLMSWLEPRITSARPGPPGDSAAPAQPWNLQLALLRGSRWSPVLTVAEGDSFFINSADIPAVCAFGAHGLAVAWLWKTGNGDYGYQTRLALSADGGGYWTDPIVVHNDERGTQHGFVSLVPQGEGARAVWLDGNNLPPGVEEGTADMTLHSRYFAASGTPGREQALDGRTCDCCPTAAVAVGEDVVVAYRDRSEDEIRDIAVTRLEGGHWTAPGIVHDDGWKIAGCPVNGPALTAVGETVAIAWYTAAADSPRVYVAFSYDAGRDFGAPTRVDDGRPIGRVGVAIVGDSLAAVSWIESDAKESRVRARFVRDHARPGAAATIARFPGSRGGVPQLMRDGDRLVFAWSERGAATQVKLAEVRIPRR